MAYSDLEFPFFERVRLLILTRVTITFDIVGVLYNNMMGEGRFSDRFTRTISLHNFCRKVFMAHPRTDGIPQLPLALALTILKSKPIEYSTRGGRISNTHFTSPSDSQ
jgi:hypothetical protein